MRYRLYIFQALMGIACLLASMAMLFYFFLTTQIRCQLDGQSCPDPLIEQLQPLLHTSLLFARHEQMIDQLLSENQTHQLTSIQRELPDTLILTFANQPFAYQLETDAETFVVRQTGQISSLSDINEVEIPTLAHIKLGQAMTADCLQTTPTTALTTTCHRWIIDFLSQVESTNLALAEITFEHPDYLSAVIIYPNDEGTTSRQLVYFPREKTNHAIFQLEQITQALQHQLIESDGRILDLRFQLPVLRPTLTIELAPKIDQATSSTIATTSATPSSSASASFVPQAAQLLSTESP